MLFALDRVNEMIKGTKTSLPRDVEIWIDGELKQEQNARVSVLDRGFLYGDSVFETLRTYGGRPFALEEHLERLESSAARVSIEMPIARAHFSSEIVRAVEHAGFEESYVRVMVTRGQGALGLNPGVAIEPLRVLIVTPLSPPPAEDYERGISVITYEASRVSDDTPAAGAKIGNYLVAVLAHKKAAEVGAKEALIRSSDGHIVEGATSNVFWLEGDSLHTPPLSAGILAGITRRHIIEAARRLGLKTHMRIPRVEELLAADGVFISSSVREMLPVVSIDGTAVGDGKVPERIRVIHAAFRSAVSGPE